jgi:predicted RNase H-like nuclease (RuvC/YqgF family)
MVKLTNISTGPRGLRTPEGVVMVDAGTTFDGELSEGEDINEEWFAKPGSKAAKAAAGDDGADDGDLAALREQVAALTKQVEDGSKTNTELTKKLDEAKKANAALTKQVEALSKTK